MVVKKKKKVVKKTKKVSKVKVVKKVKAKQVEPKKRGRPAKVKNKQAKTKKEKPLIVTAAHMEEAIKHLARMSSNDKTKNDTTITTEQISEAKSALNSMRSQDIEVIKRAFLNTNKSEWNKYTFININGTMHKALTAAIAHILGI